MEIKLSKAYSSYGADMGRPDGPIKGRCHLCLLAISRDGYDAGGAYWGLGEPMYICQDDHGNQAFVRAKDHSSAQQAILQHHPNVTFYAYKP